MTAARSPLRRLRQLRWWSWRRHELNRRGTPGLPRRAAVVDNANAIGTTYLRAQLLAEPFRTPSLQLLERYTDATIRLSRAVPTTPDARSAVADGDSLQRKLWSLAGQAIAEAPVA